MDVTFAMEAESVLHVPPVAYAYYNRAVVSCSSGVQVSAGCMPSEPKRPRSARSAVRMLTTIESRQLPVPLFASWLGKSATRSTVKAQRGKLSARSSVPVWFLIANLSGFRY